MAEYKVLYWHGIPTQVRAEDENGRTGVQLPERFQLAIDEAAMAAHLIDEDDYLEGFRWSELMERQGGAQEVAAAVARELDQEHPSIDWKETAAKINKARKDQSDPA